MSACYMLTVALNDCEDVSVCIKVLDRLTNIAILRTAQLPWLNEHRYMRFIWSQTHIHHRAY